MSGRRSTNSPTPAGMVSSAVIRIPSDAAFVKSRLRAVRDRSCHLRLERRGDRHAEQAVREDEERERQDVRRRVR